MTTTTAPTPTLLLPTNVAWTDHDAAALPDGAPFVPTFRRNVDADYWRAAPDPTPVALLLPETDDVPTVAGLIRLAPHDDGADRDAADLLSAPTPGQAAERQQLVHAGSAGRVVTSGVMQSALGSSVDLRHRRTNGGVVTYGSPVVDGVVVPTLAPLDAVTIRQTIPTVPGTVLAPHPDRPTAIRPAGHPIGPVRTATGTDCSGCHDGAPHTHLIANGCPPAIACPLASRDGHDCEPATAPVMPARLVTASLRRSWERAAARWEAGRKRRKRCGECGSLGATFDCTPCRDRVRRWDRRTNGTTVVRSTARPTAPARPRPAPAPTVDVDSPAARAARAGAVASALREAGHVDTYRQ